MNWDEVAAKFSGCAGYGGLATPAIRSVVAMVADLPALDDIRRLTALLAPEGR